MKRLIALVGTATLLVLAACGVTEDPTSSGVGIGTSPTTSPAARGQFVANTNCTPCHGSALSGDGARATPTPSLVQAHGYTWGEFIALLNVGVTRDGRWVGDVMTTSGGASVDDQRAVRLSRQLPGAVRRATDLTSTP